MVCYEEQYQSDIGVVYNSYFTSFILASHIKKNGSDLQVRNHLTQKELSNTINIQIEPNIKPK